ncbi:MAG: hypothetical protein EHM41_19525 [Chloroflexi bacterium]|nr:MAG: hypothetical protein EHM41_19525 [Chloroflexota bacterium]
MMQCPLRRETEHALQMGRNMLKALRKIHRSLKACKECPAGDDCELKQSFSDQVNEAISEISGEWEQGL